MPFPSGSGIFRFIDCEVPAHLLQYKNRPIANKTSKGRVKFTVDRAYTVKEQP